MDAGWHPRRARYLARSRWPCGLWVEMKIVDGDNNELPWDGVASGVLLVKGPWVCSGYYRLDDKPAVDEDGWFNTGDMAAIDEQGYVTITDRIKDVIKSGGEWISSIDVENAAMGHPDVSRGRRYRRVGSEVDRAATADCYSCGRIQLLISRLFWPLSRARSPSGGYLETVFLSRRFPTQQPAKSARKICATSLRTMPTLECQRIGRVLDVYPKLY